MKKILSIAVLLLTALTISAIDRYYNCGITSVEFEDQSYSGKHIFKLTIKHTGKNKAEYSSSTTYDATVTLFLTSDDGTLEGTYTSEGFSSIGSTYDKNYINTNSTEVKVTGYDGRRPHPNYVSTFVINKEGDNLYSVGECALYVTDVQNNPTNLWCYYYSFDVKEIQNQNISQKPFVFGYDPEFHQKYSHYDMTVTSVDVRRDDTDYDANRYFLTLMCTGKNRETQAVGNYEVELAIYPSSASIVGTFATQNSNTPMIAMNSYVKEIVGNSSTTRNLANDSLSSIQIKSKGENQYSFYGGTLIVDVPDANYSAVYGKKRILETKYYHFSDNGGAGIEFGYDESNTTVALTASKVAVEATADGFNVNITAANPNSLSYTVYIVIDGETLAATHQYGNTLSAWSKVSRGSNDDYAESGSTVYLVSKGANKYSISATIISESGYTYSLAAFDFTYGTATGIDAMLGDQSGMRKVMNNGVLLIERNGHMFNLQGTEVK